MDSEIQKYSCAATLFHLSHDKGDKVKRSKDFSICCFKQYKSFRCYGWPTPARKVSQAGGLHSTYKEYYKSYLNTSLVFRRPRCFLQWWFGSSARVSLWTCQARVRVRARGPRDGRRGPGTRTTAMMMMIITTTSTTSPRLAAISAEHLISHRFLLCRSRPVFGPRGVAWRVWRSRSVLRGVLDPSDVARRGVA
jgi:hypothetical protein